MAEDEPKAGRRTMDGERLIAVFSSLVEPIGRSLPASSEVVLHDLGLLPDSIVAVYGDVTGRRVGDPSTDLLLEQAVSGFKNVLGYYTRLPDGRRMRSSTMIIRDVSGTPVAALCINTDITAWASIEAIARSMIGRVSSAEAEALAAVPPEAVAAAVPEVPEAPAGDETPVRSEAFVKNVDELAAYLVQQAIANVGVPLEYMKKEHKIAVVRDLKARGMFLLREAVEMVAESLEVTRFTIYNYLNELSEEDGGEGARGGSRRTKRKEA